MLRAPNKMCLARRFAADSTTVRQGNTTTSGAFCRAFLIRFADRQALDAVTQLTKTDA